MPVDAGAKGHTMQNINTVTLSGNLGADPKIVSDKLTTFDINASSSRANPEGGYRDVPMWIEVGVANGNGNLVAKKLRKGSFVTVTGTLELREFERNDGSKGRQHRIFARSVVGSDFFVPAGQEKPREDNSDVGAAEAELAEAEDLSAAHMGASDTSVVGQQEDTDELPF